MNLWAFITALIVLNASFIGWHVYKRTQLEDEIKQRDLATLERNEAIGRLSFEYTQRLADIDNRPAPVAPERVYVKTSEVCPSGPAGLDDGAQPGRVELDRRSVESVTAVTDKFQRDFEKCSVKLEAIQEAIRTQ